MNISLVFSQQLVEHGRLAWSSGEVVEGYSSPLWVALGAIGVAVGWDPVVLLQLSSLLSAAALLWFLTPRSNIGAPIVTSLLVLVVAGSEPTSVWSMSGMETMPYALLLASGWRMLARRANPGWAIALLALSALARPEGHLHLLGGLVGLWVLRPVFQKSDRLIVAGTLISLTAYHAYRVMYFGEVLPLPVMVKALDSKPLLDGILQASLDLGMWIGPAGLAWALFRPGRRRAALAAAPLVLQALVLMKAGGDWMGHGRLIVPGALASLAVVTGGRPASPKSAHLLFAAGLSMAVVLLEVPTGGTAHVQSRELMNAVRAALEPRLDLDTTQQADLEFVVANVPSNSMIYSADVGMLGHVPDLLVRDLVGLVDKDIARSRALGDDEALARTLGRMSGEADSALCIRMVRWGEGDPISLSGDQATAYSIEHSLRDDWSTITYWCRAELARDPELALQRWSELDQRFPRHSWIGWQHALALARLGRMDDAIARMDQLAVTAPRLDLVGGGASALSFTDGPVPLKVDMSGFFELSSRGPLVSRPLSRVELNRSVLAIRGSEAVTVAMRFEDSECIVPTELYSEASSQPGVLARAACLREAASYRVAVSATEATGPAAVRLTVED